MSRAAPRFLADFEPLGAGSPSRPGRAHGPRVLLVESSAELARFLSEALADSFRVDVVGNAGEALASMAQRVPELVLSGMALPEVERLELVRRIRQEPDLQFLPVVLLADRASEQDIAAGLGLGADDYLVKPSSILELRARLDANLARSRERKLDAGWRRAVVRAMREAVLIFGADGVVLEMNDAFTALFGYTMADGPIVPPYPWWPTDEEDPQGRAALVEAFARTTRGVDVEGEYRMYRKDRTPLWVWSVGAVVSDAESGRTAYLRSLRDITREKEAQQRRAAAARVSKELARAEDLDILLGVAEHGFSVLFGGSAVLRFEGSSGHVLFGTQERSPVPERPVGVEDLGQPGSVRVARAPVEGLLLTPGEERTDWRAWVQFDQPRVVSTDELIVGDMLAQAFSQALDRVGAAVQFADKQAHLEQAIESHRLIGQAVGILVERHRLLPAQAFEHLRLASQRRGLRIRDVALRLIETGAEPDEA